MPFSNEYLDECWKIAGRWNNKATKVGDWYFDTGTGRLDVASQGEEAIIEFQSGRYVYIPNIEDLMELMDAHLKTRGFDPREKELTFIYIPDKRLPEKRWRVWIQNCGRATVAHGRSIHEALLNATLQTAVPIKVARRNLSQKAETDNLGESHGQ